MKAYDPESGPEISDWLESDEGDRLNVVEAYHRRHRIRLPNQRLHATMHVIVENQLAEGEPVVLETLTRLQHEGLTRHEGIHAIGWILAEHLVKVLDSTEQPGRAMHEPYFERLKTLTATEWRSSSME